MLGLDIFKVFHKKDSRRLSVFGLAVVMALCFIGTNVIMQHGQNAFAAKVGDVRIWWSDDDKYKAFFKNSYGNEDYTHIYYACFGSSNNCNDDYTTAFCAQPNAGIPASMSTWYPYYVVTYLSNGKTSEANTNKIKLLLYMFYYRGTAPAKAAIKTVFTDRKWDVSTWKKLYGYIHAALGYLYDGGVSGLEHGYMDNPSWVDDFQRVSTDLGTLISSNSEAWQNAQLYTLYGSWSTNVQDILWIERDAVTLTGVAVDNSGNAISGLSNVTSTVHKGSEAEITRRTKTDWKFKGWRTSKNSGTPSGGETYTVESLNSNTTVYAVYEYKAFQAKAKVSDSSTGFVTDGSKSKTITCTNTTDGCDVSFEFYLKRTAGPNNSGTTYTTQKQVSSGSWTNVDASQSSTPSSGSDGTKVKTYTEKIKPGQKICYRMTYYPFGSYSTSTTKTVTVCADAGGTFESTIDMKAKKSTDGSYTDNEFYVKPGDVVELLGTYTPTAQYAYNLSPNIIKVGDITKTGFTTVEAGFNSIVGQNVGWKNTFTVRLDARDENNESSNKIVAHEAKSNGSTSSYSKSVEYTVGMSDPGLVMTAAAKTNNDDNHKTVPKKATVTYADSNNTLTIDNAAILDSVSFVIPYNYENTTSIDSVPKLFSGESISIKYKIRTNKKWNQKVGAEYATIVRGAKWKLLVSKDGGNTWDDYGETIENQVLNDGTGSEKEVSSSIDIPDVKAGTKICFKSAVYPATSGAPENTKRDGDERWVESESICGDVAKRPSLQVWGGNIYSSGSIETSVAVKERFQNDSGEQEKGTHVFGSWGELGVISSGTVTGLASGAGYAYSKGAEKKDFCFVSTLSFANDNCVSGATGSLGISFETLDTDKDSIIGQLVDGADNTITKYESIDEVPEEIETGVVFVGDKNQDIEIKKSIKYSGNYNSLESMPKVVIYGKNINISCSVTRIDALIIAEETVNTCSDISDVNDQRRSVQLKVNGAIVANELKAERTYGAATGTNSGVPAEIINFDPSLYLWGGGSTEVESSSSYESVYLRELSPRY